MLILLFVLAQIIIILFNAVHDFITIAPFTDVQALRKRHSLKLLVTSAIIHTLIDLWGLFLTLFYYPGPYPLWVKINLIAIYTLLTIGIIHDWWIPYLFGSTEKHKEEYSVYKNTHHFLPARGDNVVPNTIHVLFHLLAWFCCAVSWYLLFDV